MTTLAKQALADGVRALAPVGPARDVQRLRGALARSERLRHALADVILTVGSSLGLQELLDHVVEIVRKATQSSGGFVHLWDGDSERLVLRAATEGAQRPFINRVRLRLGEGVTGWCALMRRAVVLNSDPLKDPRFKYFPELKEERFRAALTVPVLLPDGEVVGVLSLWSTKAGHFDNEHLTAATEVGSLVGGVIEKVRLTERATREAKVLSFLGQLSATLASPRPTEEILHAVAAMTLEAIESELCLVVLLDPSEEKLVLKAIAPSRADLVETVQEALARTALTLPKKERAEPPAAEEIFQDLAAATPEGFDEVASAPLVAASDHLGFINCYRSRRFSPDDRTLLSVIASQVALALKGARRTEVLRDDDPARQLLALMANDRTDPAVRSVAAALGVDLSKPHVVLHARLLPVDDRMGDDVPDRIARAAKMLTTTIPTFNPGSVVHCGAGRARGLIRVSSQKGAVNLQHRLQGLGDELAETFAVLLSAGLSTTRKEPSEYADGYQEAAEALDVGSNVWGEGHVVRFEELGPYAYLFRIAADPRAGRDPWMRLLASLVEYDRRRGTRLLETLDAYLECRGNARVASEQLLIHRNTLRQRLSRISDLTGIDLSETRDWLPLHLAVRLAQLRLHGFPLRVRTR